LAKVLLLENGFLAKALFGNQNYDPRRTYRAHPLGREPKSLQAEP
jgi:hypothetical protein